VPGEKKVLGLRRRSGSNESSQGSPFLCFLVKQASDFNSGKTKERYC